MDRRSFINKCGLTAVTSIGGFAGHDDFVKAHDNWANTVSDKLGNLKKKIEELSQAMMSTRVEIESIVTAMADQLMNDYLKRFTKVENRLTKIERRQAFLVCWVIALSMVTGIDIITPMLSSGLI